MKRVTNKTAMRIYTRWMTLSVSDYDFIGMDINLNEISKTEKSIIKLNWVLEDYKDYQVKKIITGLENKTQNEADYLNDKMTYLLKSYLREKKLNQIL